MKSIVCKYIVQNDPKDYIPNIYVLGRKYSNEKQIPFKDVINDFPIKELNYHFRFETQLPNSNQKVWIDIPNLDAYVPVNNAVITMKLLKLPQELKTKFKTSPHNNLNYNSEAIFTGNVPQNIFQNKNINKNELKSEIIQESKEFNEFKEPK